MFLHTVRLFTLVISAFVGVLLSSCEDLNGRQEETDTGKGKVTLSLSTGIEIKSTQAQSEVDDYDFRFVGLDGYATSEFFRYGDISWPMDWYYGIFRLEAESCSEDEAEAGYGCLRYAGISDAFSVINGQTATAWVLCNIANVRVSVYFDNAMYESFESFRLDVDAVSYVEEEEILLRSLSFNSVDKSGYYNLYDAPMYFRYKLYILIDGAEEYIPVQEGFLKGENEYEPLQLEAGDDVTFNVRYTGAPMISPNIKFIVAGERVSVKNGIDVEDYVEDSVVEDQ